MNSKSTDLIVSAVTDVASGFSQLSASADERPLFMSLVVPVYNESEVVHLFVEKISSILQPAIRFRIEIIFVNDGSTDSTLIKLLALQATDPRIRVVDLSRNFGKEAALSAGLEVSRGEVVVPIDVDLQDPPEVILEMIDRWRQGYEVVLGRRTNRDSDSWAKQASARFFYRMHNRIADVKLPADVGDFRLMDRRVVDALNKLPESRRFMKGLFAWMGFKTVTVDYVRPVRAAGTTKFNGWKLWNFAVEGATSFSTVPLRIWTYLGGIVALMSVGFAIFIFAKVLISGSAVPGYASLMVAVSLLGGIQLMGIGVLGEYLGRTYIESKRRPVFVVRELFEPDSRSDG